MPKKKDENEAAYATLQDLIHRDAKRDGLPVAPIPEPQKMKVRVEAGRKGGLKGGKARTESLTPQKRKAISKKAAVARWEKAK